MEFGTGAVPRSGFSGACHRVTGAGDSATHVSCSRRILPGPHASRRGRKACSLTYLGVGTSPVLLPLRNAGHSIAVPEDYGSPNRAQLAA